MTRNLPPKSQQTAHDTMKPAARHAWIKQWLVANHPDSCDGLHSAFVMAYIDATNAKYSLQMFGAPICRQLGRDLSAMFKAGTLKRFATGLSPGDGAMGFPKWTYVYRLITT